MLLYHLTPRFNLASIAVEGLALAYCTTQHKCIWLCTAQRSILLASHVARRHQVRLDDIVSIPATVSKAWLSRFNRGIWQFHGDIRIDELGRPFPVGRKLVEGVSIDYGVNFDDV